MDFEQLRKQELELRKLLEELDTFPQTPQITTIFLKANTYPIKKRFLKKID
ncbi:hypothetical protein [Helicobacter pylori]|uniref:hypothetical protein n=1 Tax=Helicobacter pylori TaxID=210 RepID=UPI001E4D6B2E|nr:hypothetical protein [Helicobacter pylori]